ncbi:helix-turn-helix domain-containing protein [Streptomyces sp. PCS3-D2]|uniref:helix-turn-helix domain-containing protein n=1 Tax=Streptomyces sp. PCS3-D2 TaxID=1460244 RepID=UPI00044D42A8|nr:helix-turn-helix domain-containing protein [Streptomyces sp. PCS3-D2]WKV70596.1 helix-turn-helix domain-containing protein [Streptomyces sp. PCS3-D2]
MPRPERLLDPTAGPLEEFAHTLRALRKQAGNPSYRIMAQRAHYSVATLAEAARGLHKPSLKVTLAYVAACEGDPEAWTRRWYRLSAALEGRDVPVRGQPGNGLPPTRPTAGRRPGAGASAAAARRTEPGAAARAVAPPVAAARRPAQSALTADERAELRRLRREVEQLRHANAVLKAASAIFAADLRTNSQVVYNPSDRQDPLA